MIKNFLNPKQIEKTQFTGTVVTINPLTAKIFSADDAISVVPTNNLFGIAVGSKIVINKIGNQFVAIAVIGNSSLEKCILIKTTAQSISNSTVTVVTFSSSDVDYDQLEMFDDSNDRIIIPSNGNYLVSASGRWDSDATGDRAIYIAVNGEYVTSVRVDSGTSIGHGTSANLYLEQDDYVDLRVYQSSGGALNFGNTTTYQKTTFSVVKV